MFASALVDFSLSCVRSIFAGEFFQPDDNVLQSFEVRNPAQRRSLQLRQHSLDGVWIHSFQDSFQTLNPLCNRLQHLQHFLFYGYIATESYSHAREAFGGVCVDFEKMEASLDGHPVDLTPLEFKILRFFLQNADRVVSRDELLKEAFGYHDDLPLLHNVDVHICCLRRKLEREPANPNHFCTITCKGYRFMR